MFWKKPPLAEAAPFDEDSYVPEPTDHFGNSTRTCRRRDPQNMFL
jgi:hypothetical protein